MPFPSEERLDKIQLHFIVGMGRSGTTLLTSVLNGHPELISTPENNFLVFNYPAFRSSDFSKKESALFKHSLRYNTSSTLKIWHPTPEYVNGIFVNSKNLNFNRVSKLMYLFYPAAASKPNIKCIIDKNPEYSLHVDDLKTQFPDSKFIILIRDYRANIASRKKVDRSLLKSMTILAESWNYYYRRLSKFTKRNSGSVLLLRYEDFVKEPALWSKKICDFLNVSYDPKMLDAQDRFSGNYIVSGVNLTDDQKSRIERMHSNLQREINTEQTDSWRNQLSTSEIELLDYLCQPVAKLFYNNETARSFSGFQRTLFFIRTFPLVLFTRFYLGISYYLNFLPLRLRLLFKRKL